MAQYFEGYRDEDITTDRTKKEHHLYANRPQFDKDNVNTNEAPKNYYAVSKRNIEGYKGDNYCRYCDYRDQCNTDNIIFPCSAYRRFDGISVVFKRK